MATEEITISELELADEVLADMTLPVDTATETRAVTLKQLRAWLGSALPVGSVFASVGRLDDERFTLLDGKTISRIGTYEAFCNKVVEKVQAGTWKACTEEEFNLEVSETGQCGKFVVSNDYVRIPKLGNSLCSGVIDGKIAVVGNDIALGLERKDLSTKPNFQLTGYVTNNKYGFLGTNPTTGMTDGGIVGITTDPTKSGIEGKINSVEVFYYMVISTEGQTAEVGIDINKVYEDMNLKANTSLSNLTAEGKRLVSGLGKPSTKYIDLTLGASDTTYTAPANGYIVFGKAASGAGQYIKLSSGYLTNQVVSHANGNILSIYIPVRKGKTFKANYSVGGATNSFRFIYAEGEE